MQRAKVYLDSNIYKFSATRLPRLIARQVTVNWGGKKRVVTVRDPGTVNRNERIQNPELKAEAELLPEVAALAHAGLAIFQISIETQVEIGGIPDLDSETGYFYGADRQIVEAPVQYSRVLFGGIQDWWEGQYTFLSSLKYERFLQLQRITGAYQGRSKNFNRNQLLDAFHLWCAEHNGSDFFLSLDFKLAKVIEKAKSKPLVPVVRPSQLLTTIRSGEWPKCPVNSAAGNNRT